jgi:dipeptidyl aminopeptidase/acylaminoacyl peptidase
MNRSYVVTALMSALVAITCTSEARRGPAADPLPKTIQNGDVQLAFTLDLPEGAGPFPAVVSAHGSGRITRHQLGWLAAQWTSRGFALLRFDKRGTGESTGTYVNVGTHDSPTVFPRLASDVVAAVRFLRTRPEVDPRRIGLVGNSQAGWILPIAARELGDVPFMVLMSGPVCSVGLEMYFSDLAEWSSRPLPEVNALLPSFKGPPGYDPIPTLRALNTPTLWLLGMDDRSIPIETTLANLRTLAAAGRPFEWRTYEGLGHQLSPQIWDDVGRWVERFKR